MINRIIKNIPFLFLIITLSCNNSPSNKIQKTTLVTELKEYYIDCDINDFNSIYKNFKENTYTPISISYNGKKVNARMRIRGDTSREDPKKSLKIKFDSTTFSPSEKVLNFNAEYSDQTLIRQYLSSKLMQTSGQICFNSEPVKLFLNGSFLGLYLKVENMDSNFLSRNKLSDKNNLYKATKDGACLSIFDDIDKKWEKKTNKKSDYNDLKWLIHQLSTVPNDSFYQFVQEHFEYESLVNLIALNMFLSNGSTYYHNYYLYHDLYNTGKWQVFPWDLDKSLSYYNWMPYTYHRTSSEWESDNPLIERSLLCPPIFKDIKARINELHDTYLNDDYVAPLIDQLITLIEPVAVLDSMDKIENKSEWLSHINKEKKYFDNHYDLLQSQFNEQPLSFYVHRFNQLQTDNITFTWEKSLHPKKQSITYILSYGSDFLLKDSSRTNYITNIKDTFFTIAQPKEGSYYWKVTATDGKHYTDGFNTKNVFEVKKGTPIPSPVSTNKILSLDGSPYIISKNLRINEGVELTIEPGVEIYLKQGVNIGCYGSIVAHGTSENPIVFKPDNTAKNWGYIYFYEKATSGIFKYTSFNEGVINFKKSSLMLENCTVKIDQKNLVDGEKRSGIIWGDKGEIFVDSTSFEGNKAGEGIVVYHVEATVKNSSFNNIPDAIEYISVNNGLIKNNFVSNSPDDAIDLNDCNNVHIEGNFLLNNSDKGISIGTEQYGPSQEGILIKNNVLVNNKMGISIKDSSYAHITNNTLYNNNKGINLYKKREDYKKGGEAIVSNTIISGSKDVDVFTDEWSTVKLNHCLTDNSSLEKTNITGDPHFVNPNNFDFHLKESSPCIKAGENKTDIGAYVYDSSSLQLIALSHDSTTDGWIKVQNNLNAPLDLSRYKILISSEETTKEFVFPIGSFLQPMSHLFIVYNYNLFVNTHDSGNVMGGLPKLDEKDSYIRITTPKGTIVNEQVISELNIITP